MSIGYRITKAAAVLHLCGADLIYPTFWFLSATQTLWLAIVFRILLIGAGHQHAGQHHADRLGTARVRATGTSMIYAFGVTLLAARRSDRHGCETSGNPLAPAWYVTGMLTVSHDCHFAVPGASHRIKCRQYRFCRRR